MLALRKKNYLWSWKKITLSATDPDTHVGLLSELAKILMDEEKSEALFNAESAEKFVHILHSN